MTGLNRMVGTSTKQGAILLLILQAIILVLCIVYIRTVYYQNILPDKLARQQFVPATCSISSIRLEMKKNLVKKYRARFEVIYKYNNVNYKTVTFGNGLDESFSTDRSSQTELLRDFAVGESVPCWINPNPPHQALLILRHNWESIFSLFIPSFIFLVVAYAFTKVLFKLVRRTG